MKTSKNLIAALVASMILTACGGGGSSAAPSSTPVAPTTPTGPTTPTIPTTPSNPTPTTPVVVNATDPYTGQPATGSATTMLSGVVMSDITAGAVVTAYAVQADGTNGAALGTSTPTGADGKFSLQLIAASTGPVRLIAQGGTFKSEADGTRQANTTLELVTPYLTSELNFFVITPATHIVSHVISYKAKSGSTLSAAYTSSINTLLSLSVPNVILKDDGRAGINLLKTVPGSANDVSNTYQDLLTAIEWFGVRYDLPSSVVVRVLSAYAEQGFPLNGVDGTNAPINVGKWVNGVFDEKQALSLDEMTAVRYQDGSIVHGQNGDILHDNVKGTLSTNLIQYFYRAKACTDDGAKPALLARYPGDAFLFSDAASGAGICAYDVKEIADLKSKIATNNRSK